MKDTEAIALLKKYKAGTATEEERAMLESWYLAWNDDDQSFEEEELIALRKEMWAMMPKAAPTTSKLWPRIIGLAAAVAAITLGIWFYITPRHSGEDRNPGSAQFANDIAPGKNTATLTLANGKTIVLSDAKTGVVIRQDKLAYNDGSVVRYSSGTRSSGSLKSEQMTTGPVGVHSLRVNELLTAATPRGGTYQVTLPDGTQVWLNADSKISFPSQFTGSERKILLDGEAYFEVSKNKERPFIVESGGQRVEVLGTHFNISAYQDEGSIKTTLLEGSVKVSRQPKPGGQIGKGFSEVLKPNQQAILTGNKLDVILANIEQTMAWKNGMIVFEKQSLREVMRGLSRWYDISVVYEPGVENILFTGSISRFKNISSILQILELTGKVHFKIEGRRVTVMK